MAYLNGETECGVGSVIDPFGETAAVQFTLEFTSSSSVAAWIRQEWFLIGIVICAPRDKKTLLSL